MPLLWLSLAFLSGIILGATISLPVSTWMLLALASLLLLALPRLFNTIFIRFPTPFRFIASHIPGKITHALIRLPAFLHKVRLRFSPLSFPLLLCVLLLGAARYRAAQPHINLEHIAWYNDQTAEVILEGTIIEPPDERDQYTLLRVSAEGLGLDKNPLLISIHGTLLARLPPGEDWQYGDRIHLQGHLQTPPEDEDFSYRDHLARQGIYSYMPNGTGYLLLHNQGNPIYAFIYRLRQRGLNLIYHYYPEPEASLLAGIVLGVQTGIPQTVQQAFRVTGTSHIIAISGFNITIVAGMFSVVFARLLGRRKGAIAAALGIAFYTLLVGASAAVVRAAIMGGLGLFARQVGRRQQGLNSLGIVAAIMTVASPMVLWDIGFQLSFAATLGLVLYADPLSRVFRGWAERLMPKPIVDRLAGPVGAYGLFTFAALLTTLPLTLYYFGYLPLTAPFANPLILPAQPAVIVLGGLSVLTGLVFRPLGQLMAYLAWPFTAYTIRVVEWLGGIPGSVIATGRWTMPLVVLFYVLLFGWTLTHERLKTYLTQYTPALNLKPALPLFVLALTTVLAWRVAFSAPDGRLHITLLDVGSGEAILIQTPAGSNILVNGGPSTSLLSEALGRRLSPVNHRLDWLVIAVPDEEGLASLPRLVDRYPPQNVLWAGATHGVYSSRLLWEALTLKGTPVTPMQAGHRLDLGSGISLQALTAGARGAVLLLEYDRFRLLLPLGLDFKALESLKNGETIGPVSALLLSESGFAPLNPPEWLDNLRPQVTLLSVAADDSQGLPDPQVMTSLAGFPLLRTDQNGWIELITDGGKIWINVERR